MAPTGPAQACAVRSPGDARREFRAGLADERPLRVATSRPGVQPAWLMLGGAFTAFTVSAGLMHSYAVYLVAFIEEFGWSRGETSIAYSVSQLVAGVSSPFVGALVDRLGPRRLLLLGGGLLVLGLAGQRLCRPRCGRSSCSTAW